MKKIACLLPIIAVTTLFATAAFADDDDWDGDGDGYRRCNRNGWGGYPQQQVNNYYSQPQANYYQQPPVAYYQPQPQYYPPQPQYNNGGYYDNRSHQGLAGSVVGDVLGYELGNGNPLAAGIGAAAGSFLGNGAGWRY
jgi:hypothetical protein